MRILSWNILHGGASRCDSILAAIESHQPDIVALQEFRHGKSGPVIIDGLNDLGLDQCYAPPTTHARENTLLLASCFPLECRPWPNAGDKHAISCCISLDSGYQLNLLNVHFPQKRAQLPLFESMLRLPPEWLADYSLLIGDFNCGIPLTDSETKTFYATHQFQQLLQSGWTDNWRQRNPQAREFSWISTAKGNGFRYDHALTSVKLAPLVTEVRYDHQVRQLKHSDHSLLVMDIDLI